MISIVEVLGLFAVALGLAASPLLARLLDSFFAAHNCSSMSAMSGERADIFNEVRRMTNILETEHLAAHHERQGIVKKPIIC